MGLQSAMTTALTGLQAAETSIDVVGNNVANSSTVGFKESNAVFATQFLQTQSIGSAPSDTRGGTNPRQIGLGVKVAAINPDFTQGTIEISANPLDVAIQGDGFLIIQGAQGEQYTRNGQLQTNANNEIVTVTGNSVLGFGVDDEFNIVETLTTLRIPVGEDQVAQSTENVVMSGVLTPEAEVGNTPKIITSEVLGNGEFEFPNDPLFTLGDFSEVAEPPSGSMAAAAVAGAGSLPVGDYEYRVTYFLDSGGEISESPPSNTLSITQTVGTDEIDISGLPVDAGWTDWDGRRVYRRFDGTGDYELIDEQTAPAGTTLTDDGLPQIGTATLDDDSVDQTNYSYYVTFVDPTQEAEESRPTAKIGPLSISEVNRRVRIDNLPQPTGGGDYDSIRIYRNLASDASSFHRVATLSAGVTTWVDNVPDADIETEPKIDLMGAKANGGLELVNVVVRDGETYSQPFQVGTLSFTGSKGDRTLAAQQLTITATTTVQELVEFMDQAFGIDNPDYTELAAVDPSFGVSAGGSIGADGLITFTSNMGLENALGVSLSGLQITPTGSSTSSSIGLGFTETQEANGIGSTTDFVVYDSLGVALNVRVTTVLEQKDGDSTTYRWFATSQDNEPLTGVDTNLGSGTITFNGSGTVTTGGTGTIAIDRLDSASESP